MEGNLLRGGGGRGGGGGGGWGREVASGREGRVGEGVGQVEERLSWALMMRAGAIAHTFTCQQASVCERERVCVCVFVRGR
jgi:hypothetical protein